MDGFTSEVSPECWQQPIASPDAAEGFCWPWQVSLSSVRSQVFKAIVWLPSSQTSLPLMTGTRCFPRRQMETCLRTGPSSSASPSGTASRWRRPLMQPPAVCAHAQPCPTLFHPMDYSPPGSSVHGIFQARILEPVALSSSRDLLDPVIEPVPPHLLHCRWILYHWAIWEACSHPSYPLTNDETKTNQTKDKLVTAWKLQQWLPSW